MKNKLLLSLLPLETKRLIINKTTLKDIDLLLKLDKQLITQKYLGGIKTKSKEERLAFFNKKKDRSLTIYLKDNTAIGFIELKIDNNSAELEYIIDYDYTNKGYCTEACKLLIEIAFSKLNINRIYASINKNNINSKRVLEKIGFKLAKTADFLEYELFKE